MGFLTLPIMLAGLVALPVLAGIYLLQMRYRRRVVSSHVIWQQLTAVRSGGQRVQQFRPPWLLLLLELLIIAALVIAAAGPRATAATVRVPVAVVLDNAFAMQAGEDETVRERAVEALENQLSPGRHRVRLIAAGVEPRLLGDIIEQPDDLRRTLADWRPTGPRTDLDAAIATASEMVGESGRVLIVSDRGPGERELEAEGRLRWWAGGEVQPNIAIINAWRSGSTGEAGDGQTVGVELRNFSTADAQVTVRIEQDGRTPERLAVTLQPGQTRRVRTTVTSAAAVRVTLEGEDALAADDTAVLLDPMQPPVAVAIAIEDEAAAERIGPAVRRALDATGRVRFVSSMQQAELVVTDSPDVHPTADRHVLRLIRGEGETGVLDGPFAMDAGHPLTEGLALSGVLWSIGRGDGSEQNSAAAIMRGLPLVTAGNQTLLSIAEHASGGRTVSLRWRAEGSNLADAPDWVILLDNLVRWRQAARPGAAQVNLAVGQRAQVRLPRGVNSLELQSPTGERQTLRAPGGELSLLLDETGVWQYRAGEGDDRQLEGRLAVNAISPRASDLRDVESGSWGGWSETDTLGRGYTEIAWIIVLAATGLLLWHGWLLRRTGGAA